MTKKDTLSKKKIQQESKKNLLKNEFKKRLIKNLHKILKNLILNLKKVPGQRT